MYGWLAKPTGGLLPPTNIEKLGSPLGSGTLLVHVDDDAMLLRSKRVLAASYFIGAVR